jgi:hypothetical protein
MSLVMCNIATSGNDNNNNSNNHNLSHHNDTEKNSVTIYRWDFMSSFLIRADRFLLFVTVFFEWSNNTLSLKAN